MLIRTAKLYAELIYPFPGSHFDNDRIAFDWYRNLAFVCFTATQWDEIHACL